MSFVHERHCYGLIAALNWILSRKAPLTCSVSFVRVQVENSWKYLQTTMTLTNFNEQLFVSSRTFQRIKIPISHNINIDTVRHLTHSSFERKNIWKWQKKTLSVGLSPIVCYEAGWDGSSPTRDRKKKQNHKNVYFVERKTASSKSWWTSANVFRQLKSILPNGSTQARWKNKSRKPKSMNSKYSETKTSCQLAPVDRITPNDLFMFRLPAQIVYVQRWVSC